MLSYCQGTYIQNDQDQPFDNINVISSGKVTFLVFNTYNVTTKTKLKGSDFHDHIFYLWNSLLFLFID